MAELLTAEMALAQAEQWHLHHWSKCTVEIKREALVAIDAQITALYYGCSLLCSLCAKGVRQEKFATIYHVKNGKLYRCEAHQLAVVITQLREERKKLEAA